VNVRATVHLMTAKWSIAIAIVAAMVAASGAASADRRITLESGVEDAMKTALGEALNDPESARFRKIKAMWRDELGIGVCGELNAKNGFGGYVGYRPFVAVLGKDPAAQWVYEIAGSTDVDALHRVLAACADLGLGQPPPPNPKAVAKTKAKIYYDRLLK
jgi:hypothetical protein